jgi:hypothetical protein
MQCRLAKDLGYEKNRLIPYEANTAVVGFVSHIWTKREMTYADCSDGIIPQDNRKLKAIRC